MDSVQSGQEKRRLRRIFQIAAALYVVLVLVMTNTLVREFIDTSFSQRVQFLLRDRLRLSPPLTDRLKILAIDDASFAYIGGPAPRTDAWVKLLTNIARQNPSAILIDGLFSSKPPQLPEIEKALQQLRELQLPIYTGAYVQTQPLAYRDELSLDQPAFDLLRYIDDPQFMARSLPSLAEQRGAKVYGPIVDYKGAFRGQGHIVHESVRKVAPLYRLQENRVVPHLALYAAQSIRFRDKELLINDQPVPLDRDGRVFLNHRPPQMFPAKSFRFALKRAENGEVEKNVQPGDVVLILSNYSTGNSDIVDNGYFGAVPGGLHIAALVDSVLTDRWLTPLEWDNSLALVFCAWGVVIGLFAAPMAFWLLSLLVVTLYFTSVTYLFSVHSMVLPWTLPLMGFIGSGLIQFACRSIFAEMDRLALQKDFFAEKALRLEEENKKIILEQSLALGRAVQNLLLPKSPTSRFGSFQFETLYQPAQVMSGDWLYIWERSPEERCVLVGDVMGKGPSAAIPVAIIIGVLKDCENLRLSLEEAIRRLNNRFVELFHGQITATVAAIEMHKDGRVTFFNAGSPGWYLVQGERASCLSMRSNPIGLSLDFTPARGETRVSPETVLFTFTDGYLEGSRALRRLVRELAQTEPQQRDSATIHQVLMHAGEGSRLDDDRTLLTVRVA